jgi:Mg2+ and Co2+ transporter CorA
MSTNSTSSVHEKLAQIEKPQQPDHFSFFSSDTLNTSTGSSWDELFPGGEIDHIIQEKTKQRPDPSRPTWWIDVCDASEEDVSQLAQALSIHPLTVEDIVIREPREKVEVFKNYYLISFQTLVDNAKEEEERPGYPHPAEMYILVFQYGVVTFSPSGCHHIKRVRSRIRKMHDPLILSSDWICYALM